MEGELKKEDLKTIKNMLNRRKKDQTAYDN
jgi:hypothetical protein